MKAMKVEAMSCRAVLCLANIDDRWLCRFHSAPILVLYARFTLPFRHSSSREQMATCDYVCTAERGGVASGLLELFAAKKKALVYAIH